MLDNPRVIEARDRLYWMISGYRTTQMVRAAVVLGAFDQLAATPMDAVELAALVGADSGLLNRLLRALSSYGVVTENEDGKFSNTQLGDLLRKDVEGSVRNVALGLTEDVWYEAWEQLPGAVRDGALPFQRAHPAKTFWEVIEANPEVKARFNGFMVAQTEAFAPQLLAAFDFSACRQVVDVGGGNGALIASVLVGHPSLRGVLFDLEPGLDGADEYLRKRGVRDRCELVPGNFFDSVPEVGDAYLLKYVLHDWDDDRAAAILASCRRWMRPGTHVLVIDQLLPRRATDTSNDRFSLTLDMHMYALFGARERTEDELLGMLGRAGFEVERVAPTWPPSTIVARAV
jgi:orsellinic acid C2-O-methyltransferase